MPVFVELEDEDVEAIKNVGGLSERTKKIRANMIKNLENFLKDLNIEIGGEANSAEANSAEANSTEANSTEATDNTTTPVLDFLVKQVL